MGYIFDANRLHDIANQTVGTAPEEMFDRLAKLLEEQYPGHIEMERRWIINNAGGAMGQMALLHASISEYILLFGTPIGTEGNSGRYRAEVQDYMISGEMWCYQEGETERRVYKTGDAAVLDRRKVKGYRIPDSAWMLEYARGPIPLMIPFGIADVLTSTLDFKNLGRTLAHYARLSTRELLKGKV